MVENTEDNTVISYWYDSDKGNSQAIELNPGYYDYKNHCHYLLVSFCSVTAGLSNGHLVTN